MRLRPINAIFASAACLMLGACSISVDDDGISSGSRHRSYNSDHVSVTLPSGEKDSFSCPDEMDIFIIDNTAEGKGLVYGCRSRGATIPDAE